MTEQPRSPKQKSFQEQLPNGVLLDMVYIPAGDFLMGSPFNDKEGLPFEWPQHEVQVPAFYMGKYPVTQAQWCAVATLPLVERELNPYPSSFGGNNRPVEGVSWYQTVEFCQRLSRHSGKVYRLPSESEWEYACRAGTTTRYFFGDELTKEQANFGNAAGETTPVGQYPANTFGLYDMHGNVMEWCEDIYHSSYKGAPTDGSVWSSKDFLAPRVVRGGNWIAESKYCRSAARGNYGYLIKFKVLGFRVCCSFSKA